MIHIALQGLGFQYATPYQAPVQPLEGIDRRSERLLIECQIFVPLRLLRLS